MKKEKGENPKQRISSSFRDPDGFLFSEGNVLYRQVNLAYQNHYDCLMNSGLFQELGKKGLLILHTEVDTKRRFSQDAYKIIRPEFVPFISYPYEWCFDQLKDAALATLQIQKYALDFGMILKDASAYNIQFFHGEPKLIDTLSFEIYREGFPWVAYRQFCQHFLVPLALMSYRDVRLLQLMRVYIDGIPLDLANSLLPFRAFLHPSIWAHIRFHASLQRRHAVLRREQRPTPFLGKRGLLALIDNLESLIASLRWKPKGTEWAEYYSSTNYSDQAFDSKRKIIEGFLAAVHPDQVWDMGGNTGVFSRIASDKGIETICFDVDPVAVEKNYIHVRTKQEKHMLPLVLDFANPSSAIGWAHQERNSLAERGPAGVVFALALVHHLMITNNLSFLNIAKFFSEIGKWLIVEFIPRDDSNVQRMLQKNMRTLPGYDREDFEFACKKYFLIKQAKPISGSKRIMYLMKKS